MTTETFAFIENYAPGIVTATLVLIACFTDIRSRRIPNILVLIGLVFGLIFNLYISQLPGLLDWALGFTAGMAFLIVPYLLGGMGAGDVKLLGMIGAIMGLPFVCYAFIFMALWGGLGALLALWRSGRMRILVMKLVNRELWAAMRTPEGATDKDSLPYGVAIGLGVATTFLWRCWMP